MDSSQLLTFISETYDLGTITAYKSLEAKGGRLVYKLTTTKKEVIIKVSSKETTKEKIERDIYILLYLEQYQFPAPILLRTVDMNTIVEYQGKYIYVYTFIPGKVPLPSPAYFENLGHLLATLHSIPSDTYPFRSTFTPEIIFPQIKQKLATIREEDKEKQNILLDDIDAFPSFGSLPQSLIHTDPYFANLVQGDNLSFIDLDDAGVAPALIDVGYVLAHSCTTTQYDREELGVESGSGIQWHEKWARIFLTSYQSIRPLGEEEKKLLVYAAQFGMIAYIMDWEIEHAVSERMFERYLLLKKYVPTLI